MYYKYVFTNIFFYMDISERHSTAKQVSELLCRHSLNRQLWNILTRPKQLGNEGREPSLQATAWSNGSKNHIFLLGWRVIKPYIITRPLIKIWPWYYHDLISHLHSDEWLQVFHIYKRLPVYILQFNPKYCLSCQSPLKKSSLTRTAVSITTAQNEKTCQNTKLKKIWPRSNQMEVFCNQNTSTFCDRDFWLLCGKTVTNSLN